MKNSRSSLQKGRIRFLAAIDKVACFEVFLELQAQVLGILRQRGKQGTSHTRSLKNASQVKIHRRGGQLVLSWHNTQAENGRSSLQFRKRDRLANWLHAHVLNRPRHRYGNSRRIKDERRAARRRKRRLQLYHAQRTLAEIVEDIALEEEQRIQMMTSVQVDKTRPQAA